MRRAVLILVSLLLLGCARLPQSGAEAKSSGNSKITPESQIKVLVYEYLIRTVLEAPVGFVLFIDLEPAERNELRVAFPNISIYPSSQYVYVPGLGIRERMSRKRGAHISLDSVQTDGRTAVVIATVMAGGGASYEFKLSRDGGWRIESARPFLYVD